jgi:magnesium-protoporphyrin IX monomethyl ester (oxidative) cyclase
LQRASADMDRAKKRRGIGGAVGRAWAGTRAAVAFARLYTIPAKKHRVPDNPRLQPAY